MWHESFLLNYIKFNIFFYQFSDSFTGKPTGFGRCHQSIPEGECDGRDDEAGVGHVLAQALARAGLDLTVLDRSRIDDVLQRKNIYRSIIRSSLPESFDWHLKEEGENESTNQRHLIMSRQKPFNFGVQIRQINLGDVIWNWFIQVQLYGFYIWCFSIKFLFWFKHKQLRTRIIYIDDHNKF